MRIITVSRSLVIKTVVRKGIKEHLFHLSQKNSRELCVINNEIIIYKIKEVCLFVSPQKRQRSDDY